MEQPFQEEHTYWQYMKFDHTKHDVEQLAYGYWF